MRLDSILLDAFGAQAWRGCPKTESVTPSPQFAVQPVERLSLQQARPKPWTVHSCVASPPRLNPRFTQPPVTLTTQQLASRRLEAHWGCSVRAT